MYRMSDRDDDTETFEEARDASTQQEDQDDQERDIMREPNRSVYNLTLAGVDDDDDNVSHSTRSYMEVDDVPLPIISDSESSRWSRFGQCCDCCDACLRKRKWLFECKCGWMKVMFYYLTINVCMVIFFTLAMYMSQLNFYQSPDTPPFKQLEFKSDQYPGLSMDPSMINLLYAPLSLIWYSLQGNNTWENRNQEPYVSRLTEVIYDLAKACETAKPCFFNQESLGPCQEPDYGYKNMTPCIFLKLNKLTLWLPEEYKSSSAIPEDVPFELRTKINVTSPRLWVHCQGETLYDQSKLGNIDYYPGPYFNSSFFPLSSLGDTNPIIAIRLSGVQKGVILKLVCGLFAKNVNEHSAYYAYIYIKD